MPKPTLIIGNRNYSSWSLRPRILARHLDVECDEHLISLDQADSFMQEWLAAAAAEPWTADTEAVGL